MRKKYVFIAVLVLLVLGLLLPFFYRSNGQSVLVIDNEIPLVGRYNNIVAKKDTFILKKDTIEIGYFKLKQDGKNYTLVFEDGIDYDKGVGFTMLGKFENIFGIKTMLVPIYSSDIAGKVKKYLKKQENLEERESFSITFGPDDIKDFGVNGLTCGLTDVSVFNNKPCVFVGNLKEWIIYITKEIKYGGLEELKIKIK